LRKFLTLIQISPLVTITDGKQQFVSPKLRGIMHELNIEAALTFTEISRPFVLLSVKLVAVKFSPDQLFQKEES
jgi:hypothetical protein